MPADHPDTAPRPRARLTQYSEGRELAVLGAPRLDVPRLNPAPGRVCPIR
jgi:hypothetical protein